jgi:integrase/recombinase XerD
MLHPCCTFKTTAMQKHSLKLVLRKDKKNKLGLHPIYIRITVNRKSSFMASGYYIHPSLWDERNERVKDMHPMANSINLDITNKKKNVLEDIVQSSINKTSITAATIKEKAVMGKDRTCIFSFADRYVKEIDSKRAEGTKDNWEVHLKKLEAFNGSRELDFNDVTIDYLNAFEVYLRGKAVERVEGRNPDNYIALIMRTIRALFNAAIKKDLITAYPFKYYEMPKSTPGKKHRLTLDELDRWEVFVKETKVKRFRQTGVWFLFGCYTGLRVSDWHNFDFDNSVHHNYISIEAIKNKGKVAVPIHERMKRVLDLVKNTPLNKPRQVLNEILKEMAKEMKIKKSLSTHCARHTFAITLCAERGVPAETCATLMGITVNVCVMNYYRVTPEKIRRETESAWVGL